MHRVDGDMQERNILSGATSAFLVPLVDGWHNLIIWLLFAIVLIGFDLRVGIKAARKRGETIRWSRAIRRTLNKLVDYICYLSIAWFLGHTFGTSFDVPLLAIVVLAVVYGIELASIVSNFLEYKGLKKKVNVWKLLGVIFKKYNLSDFLEDDNK